MPGSQHILAAALAAVALSLPSALAQKLYPPAEYAVTLRARGAADVEGVICAPIYASIWQDEVIVIQCQSQSMDTWVSFNVVPEDLSLFPDQFQEGQPLYFTPRPGLGLPMGINEDGVLQSAFSTQASTVSLYLPNGAVPYSASLQNISFTASGTNSFIMMVDDKLCGLDFVTIGNTTYENIIVCNIDPQEESFEDAAMKLSLSPLGWSWNYKRVQLLSAVNKQPCGNVFFEEKPQAIICPDNGDVPENFESDFSSNILPEEVLPMSSGGVFGMQTWLEYQLPTYYWRTMGNGSVVAAPALNWNNWGFKLMLVNNNAGLGRRALRDSSSSSELSVQEDGTPIPVGAEVYLKSTTTKKYCKVGQRLNRIVCNSNSENVKASRLKHTFIYNEFIPN